MSSLSMCCANGLLLNRLVLLLLPFSCDDEELLPNEAEEEFRPNEPPEAPLF